MSPCLASVEIRDKRDLIGRGKPGRFKVPRRGGGSLTNKRSRPLAARDADTERVIFVTRLGAWPMKEENARVGNGVEETKDTKAGRGRIKAIR